MSVAGSAPDQDSAGGRRRALVIAYDGGAYAGWQVQPDRPTVESEIEAALSAALGRPVGIVGAGRTDAGVHARGQVAHFDDPCGWPVERLTAALNTALPGDIRILGAAEVPEGFHALGDAVDKTYAYSLYRSRTQGGQRTVELSVPPRLRHTHLAVRSDLNLEAMREVARVLVGRHDWTTLSKAMPPGRSTVKTVRAVRLLTAPDRLTVVVTGEGFLYGMVRLMAGLLVEIGAGRRHPGEVAALLAARDRTAAPASLAAHGLSLWMVRYARPGPDGARPRRLLS